MTAKDSDNRLGRLKALQAKKLSAQAAPDPVPAIKKDSGQRSGLMQRLRDHLKGDDGKIDQKKAKQFLLFVKKQSADPEAPRHEMAKRITEKLQNLPPAQRQKILNAAGLSGGTGGEGASGGAKGGGAKGRGAGANRAAGRSAPPKQHEETDEDWFDSLADNL